MLKNMQKSVCALAVLAATAMPALAAGIDIKVIGTITPVACTPTISGGGTIDYGNIPTESLATNAFTVLSEKELDFAITCSAPTKVAVHATNGRPGTLAGVTESAIGATVPPVALLGAATTPAVGLGLDGTAKIGGYATRLQDGTAIADGVAVANISSKNGGTVWTPAAGSVYQENTDSLVSWAMTGGNTPVAFATLSTKLRVQAYINKASALDLSKPVALDGLTTLELVYL